MKRKVTSGEKNRGCSREKDQQDLIWQMGLFSEIWTDWMEIAGPPSLSLCSLWLHWQIHCTEAWNDFVPQCLWLNYKCISCHTSKKSEATSFGQLVWDWGQSSHLYKHFRASATRFLLCTNKPLFSVKFWTQREKLARTSPLVERLLSTATQKKVFYKQNCKVI